MESLKFWINLKLFLQHVENISYYKKQLEYYDYFSNNLKEINPSLSLNAEL